MDKELLKGVINYIFADIIDNLDKYIQSFMDE